VGRLFCRDGDEKDSINDGYLPLHLPLYCPRKVAEIANRNVVDGDIAPFQDSNFAKATSECTIS
jgi:hypothetical protein